ncbi:hypothetical protein AB0H37_24660 [Actinomadura sp. NPDC023710]|uniref:hypothetical protein n=1 Tax=Actinomadura sp. NPDC023710 TaxID=3158219 RepID=UPI00340742F0
MTVGAIVFTFFFSLLINECSELSPWLAHKLVRWSARLRCDEPVEAEALAEELAAYIDDRPGKLFKLLTSLGFAGSSLARRLLSSRHWSLMGRTANWESSVEFRQNAAFQSTSLTADDFLSLTDALRFAAHAPFDDSHSRPTTDRNVRRVDFGVDVTGQASVVVDPQARMLRVFDVRWVS